MAIFDPLVDALGFVLSLFYAVIPNLGVAIILLTFTIMLLLYPLTAKQAKSMIRMQMVQPEIKRLQAKYKNDRQKLNEETMRFYQENKINPLAGCLPLLVQMPIFFALFRALRSTYEHVPTSSKLYEALCTAPNGTLRGVNACGAGPQTPVHQKFLGMDLSVSAPNQVGLWASALAFALVILVMLSGYLQSRQAQKRTPAVNKQMAMITKVLPVFFGFISLNFPAGLVVYFFVSNVWRLAQQEVIFRHIGTAADPKHKSLVNPPKAAIVDAESRERTEDAAAEEPAPPSKPAKAPSKNGAETAPVRAAKPARAASAAKPVVPPARGTGGLRGLFQPPPPPDTTARGAAKAPVAKPGAKPATKPAPKPAASPAERPGQAGRRTSKKKRKR